MALFFPDISFLIIFCFLITTPFVDIKTRDNNISKTVIYLLRCFHERDYLFIVKNRD